MELNTKLEESLVRLMITANKDKLKYLVDNNLSLIQFAFNHPQFSKAKFLMSILSPLIDVEGISAERVMGFLQEKRPDIAQTVNLNWIKNQIDELKRL